MMWGRLARNMLTLFIVRKSCSLAGMPCSLQLAFRSIKENLSEKYFADLLSGSFGYR